MKTGTYPDKFGFCQTLSIPIYKPGVCQPQASRHLKITFVQNVSKCDPQSKIFNIMHYKTIVKMHYFKKNFIKFSNGQIHSILRPILKPQVPLYSLELEEFENLFIIFIFQCFCSKRAFVCAWLKIANFRCFRKRKQLHTRVRTYVAIFNK